MRVVSRGPGMKSSKCFLADETGAVTVDWVVLTSTTLLLVLIGSVFLKDPVKDLADYIAGVMQGFHVTLTE